MSKRDWEALGLSRKKAILTVVTAIVLLVAAIGILGKIANFHRTAQAIASANGWWFLACLAGQVIAYIGYIFAYRDFARAAHGPKLSWWETSRVVGVGIGAGILGATTAALAVDFWALSQTGAKTHEAARRVLALNTMEWANLSILAVVAAAILLAGFDQGAPLAVTLSWIVVVPLCYLAAIWFSSPNRVARYADLSATTPRLSLGTLAAWLWSNLKKGFSDAIGGVAIVRHIMKHPKDYKAGNLGFYIFWAGHIFTLYAAISAVGYSLGLAALVLAYATAFLLTILPLPVGGAGGVESVLTLSLHMVGLPLHLALVSALVFRFFTFWLPILPALVLLPTAGSLKRKLSYIKRDKTTPRLKHIQLEHQ